MHHKAAPFQTEARGGFFYARANKGAPINEARKGEGPGPSDAGVRLDDPACKYCARKEIDREVNRTYGIGVCYGCKRDRMVFLTKTAGMSEFLISAAEIDGIRHIASRNPLKEGWSAMKLFWKEDLEAHSLEKHGGRLEEEKERRKARAYERKRRAIEKKASELRRSTRLKKRTSQEKAPHKHEFVGNLGGEGRCSCGMVVHQEEI